MILDKLRMIEWLVIAAALLALIYYVAPAQLPVFAYKTANVTFFAFLGYWIDRRLFPHARTHTRAYAPHLAASMQTRRAIIVGAVILAGALAL